MNSPSSSSPAAQAPIPENQSIPTAATSSSVRGSDEGAGDESGRRFAASCWCQDNNKKRGTINPRRVGDEIDSYSLAYSVGSLLNQLFGKGKEPFWQQAYTNLVRFTIELHRLEEHP